MDRRNRLPTSKLARKKRKQLYIRTSLFFILAIVSVVGLSYLSAWSKITIHATEVKGNDVIEASSLIAIADQSMEGKHLMLFSKENKFLYPKDVIKEKITDTYKRIKAISLETHNGTLVISIEEREPIGLWCDSEYVFNPEVLCYYIDEFGYIFEQAPKFSDEVYVTYVGNTKSHPVGTHYLPKEQFEDLVAFHKEIDELGLPVTVVIAKEGGEYELHVKNEGKREKASQINEILSGADLTFEGAVTFIPQADIGKIYFNTRSPYGEILNNLDIFLTDATQNNNGKLPSYEYIDLRFGNNIVFKLN